MGRGQLKESSVDWIGTIPAHWDVARTRYVAKLESGHTPSRNVPEYWDDCHIPWFTLNDVWQIREGRRYVDQTAELISDLGLANSSARLLPQGTVILSRTASVGFTGILSRPMATTQDFVNWICGPRLQAEYLCYVFQGMAQEFRRVMRGSTHQTIYMPVVQQFSTPIPPRGEQQAIATFLDRETARIDALIEKKRRLLELLEEKRLAVITHAVTKGLDPSAPMKDSGIDWLGHIPAHWEVKRLRFVMERIEQGWSPQCHNQQAEEDEWGVLKVGCVNGTFFDPTENKALPADLEPRAQYEIRSGDVLMSRANTKQLLGSAAVVRKVRPRLLLCDKLYRLVVSDRVDRDYVVLAMRTEFARFQYERAATGTSGSMQNIGQDTIKDLVLPLPPPGEQQGVVKHIAEFDQRAERTQLFIETAIARLQEYRSALIINAVTGKIDVRAAAQREAAE